MIDLLAQSEATPAAHPDAPAGLTDAAAALDPAVIWARIESWCADRWTPRAVAWTIQGRAGDEFVPPLGPLISHSAERWWDTEWTAVDLMQGPLGLCLPSDGTFRIAGQVGAGPVPAPVSEAFRRLAEYSAEIGSAADGFTRVSDGVDGVSYERAATWAARAIQNSGAADLLRPYRRA